MRARRCRRTRWLRQSPLSNGVRQARSAPGQPTAHRSGPHPERSDGGACLGHGLGAPGVCASVLFVGGGGSSAESFRVGALSFGAGDALSACHRIRRGIGVPAVAWGPARGASVGELSTLPRGWSAPCAQHQPLPIHAVYLDVRRRGLRAAGRDRCSARVARKVGVGGPSAHPEMADTTGGWKVRGHDRIRLRVLQPQGWGRYGNLSRATGPRVREINCHCLGGATEPGVSQWHAAPRRSPAASSRGSMVMR